MLATLFAGVLLGALDIAIVGPALPAIQAAFGVDGRALAWVFNIYILVSLIAAPLLAKVSDVTGRRGVYVACVVLFGLGSLIVASADSFTAVLAGRAVQALGAGGLFPVASAVIADTVPEAKRGRALGLIGAVFGVAFVIGPVLGGLLLPFGWTWLFLINLPLVVVVALVSWHTLPGRSSGRALHFDWPGAVLLGGMLTALAWGFSHMQDASPSGASIWNGGATFLVLAAALAALFRWREGRARDAIFHPELLASRQLKIVGAIAVTTGVVEAGMVFLPTLAVEAFQVAAGTASYMMLPLVATLLLGAPAAGRLLDRVGARPVIQAGLAFTAVGLFLFSSLPLSPPSFYLAGACTGLGLSGLLGAPLRFVVLREAGPGHRGAGQGLLTLFLGAGRIAGAALIGGVAAAGVDQFSGHRAALFYLGLVCCTALVFSLALAARKQTQPA
jgi:MFS family permease